MFLGHERDRQHCAPAAWLRAANLQIAHTRLSSDLLTDQHLPILFLL
jgi:hypothetical protein